MSVQVNVIGRLGADSELKTTKQGKEFVTFNLAVDDYNQGQKKTVWFAVADFTETAKRKAEYLKKGSLISVQGLETCRIYQDRQGLHQIARDILATNIEFVPTSNRQEKEEVENTATCGTLEKPQQPTPQVATTASSSTSIDVEDDLPF